MYNKHIGIKTTTDSDIENTMRLWNDGEVMRFVGYPKGLNVDMTYMEKWLEKTVARPHTKHYSIYAEGIGYCGEVYYGLVDEARGLAALDIKLLSYARGKGIAQYACNFAITQAFKDDAITRIYVDPHPKNEKALALYLKLGFDEATRPDCVKASENPYLELTREGNK